VDAEGMTSALMFSCSGRCGHRRRDWLGSDVALSQSAGYAAGWIRGSEFARSSKVPRIRLPAWKHSFNSLPDARSETNCILFTSSFESARVMKDETRVASEHRFIIDAVVATLVGIRSLSRTFS
jgi:hypothetical protein